MFYLSLVVFKLLALFLFVFPRPIFIFSGHYLGAIAQIFGFRVSMVRESIGLAFPEKGLAERESLLQQSFRELGVLALETVRFFYRFDRFVENNCHVEGKEHLEAAKAGGKGVLLLTSSIGNRELLAAAGPNLLGTPVTIVARQLEPHWLSRAFEITRSLLGVRTAFEPHAMPDILRALQRNEAVAFMEQYGSIAALALRSGAPVLPALAVRQKQGRYLVRFEPELKFESGGNLIANTALLVRHTEAWMREFPTQCVWIHRRWKGDLLN